MNRPYTIHRPGPLTPVTTDVWTIDDVTPGPRSIPRKMTIVRRPDGLLFFNAIPVPEETLEQLRALGTPMALLVPNAFHALDAAPFALKLNVPAYASDVAREALKDRLTAKPLSDLPADASTTLFTVEGFRTHETVLVFRDTLVVADLVTNLAHQPGFTGLIMKWLGFTGADLRLPKPVRKRVERDTDAVRKLINQLADLPLQRVIPSHGAVLSADVPGALRRVAEQL